MKFIEICQKLKKILHRGLAGQKPDEYNPRDTIGSTEEKSPSNTIF